MRARLTFIEPMRGIQMMEMFDPPMFPSVGDVTESPDGRLWVITQRGFIPPAKTNVLKVQEDRGDMLEVRCMIAQINDDGTFVDARYYKTEGGAQDAGQSDTDQVNP
jgi:hypothetical protein